MEQTLGHPVCASSFTQMYYHFVPGRANTFVLDNCLIKGLPLVTNLLTDSGWVQTHRNDPEEVTFECLAIRGFSHIHSKAPDPSIRLSLFTPQRGFSTLPGALSLEAFKLLETLFFF